MSIVPRRHFGFSAPPRSPFSFIQTATTIAAFIVCLVALAGFFWHYGSVR
jgi:hypothetical protein